MKKDSIISMVSDFDNYKLWNLYSIYKPNMRKKEVKVKFLNVILNKLAEWNELSEIHERQSLLNLKFRVDKLLKQYQLI